MTGDAEENVEKEILKENNNLKATILKVGHHGSNTATTAEFIEAINPTYALISCGENNRYKHPSQEVLERLNKYDIQTFRTDKHGDVVLKIEQDKIEVLVEK